ncbi:peptidyl-prolyl cis-trans isomerase [Metasolibacillus meyeri]|uniref:Peptidyl-prolyl cis-trans isomerase n=1 Tax=Metasolibacillus meyeri TaxID=1071052 RepID=A0AAW9NW59_9BACL|nr:peptidyl-prolyl cis-trans isomerase [Metasolibacillus meyeri]MEC1179491.1 peptidyl-prolyl cis-trans isomerase [Metasolibacillus meyeri]
MQGIIPIKGAVTYNLTLDPTVWIFDDRKLDLKTYFDEKPTQEDDEKYLREVGAHWSREIMEGAVFPPTLKTERKFDRKGMLTGTFGIEIKPFLNNAGIKEGATEVVFECRNGEEHRFSIEEAKTLIFKYSHDGKPLTEDGPVHLLFADGSNVNHPITHVEAIRVQ